ncbi:MAG: hypothetical protein ACQEQF_00310 [Bacillota bacterium]
MPTITTTQIEIDGDVHKEYFAEDQLGGNISANSSGYMGDLETTFSIPANIDADVIIVMTATFIGSSTSELYPYSPVTYGIEFDGTVLRETTVKPLVFRNDSGVSSYSAINGTLVAGKKEVSAGNHTIKIPYSSGDSPIQASNRSIQIIVFYK